MKFATFLELGRSSNLPTVWTNVLVGTWLATGTQSSPALPWVLGAATSFYVGGMLLNDAFDAGWDARHRPERPIPSGRARRREVFTFGTLLLVTGLGLLLANVLRSGSGGAAIVAGLFTTVAIVLYNRWHKGFVLAPWVMGLCRAGVYAMGALSLGGPLAPSWLGAAAASLGYVVGLTHVARFETGTIVARSWVLGLLFAPTVVSVYLAQARGTFNLVVLATSLCSALWTVRALRRARSGHPGAIGQAVGALIAGLALVDASYLASSGAPLLALGAALAFVATLWGQRRIAGT